MWHTVEFSRFERAPQPAASGRFWGNPSNLLPCLPSVKPPRGDPSRETWASIVPPSGRRRDCLSMLIEGCCSVHFRGLVQSCGECSVVGSRHDITCLLHASQITEISGVSPRSAW
jgi:hypothetical protein